MNLIKAFTRKKRKDLGPNRAYAISNWELFYENSQSKRAKNLDYALIPHGYEMRGFQERIMEHPDRYLLMTAWHLLLIEATRCPQRGLFVDLSGPISLERLAKKLELSEADLAKSLEFFIEELHLMKEVECPQALILSGRSTRRARKGRRGRQVIELEDIEEGPLVHVDYEYSVVDHDGTAVITREAPAYMLPDEEEEPSQNNPQQAAQNTPQNVVDHTSSTPNPPQKAPENEAKKMLDLMLSFAKPAPTPEVFSSPEKPAHNVVDHTSHTSQDTTSEEPSEKEEEPPEEPPKPLSDKDKDRLRRFKEEYYRLMRLKQHCEKHGSYEDADGNRQVFDEEAQNRIHLVQIVLDDLRAKERQYVIYHNKCQREHLEALYRKTHPERTG